MSVVRRAKLGFGGTVGAVVACRGGELSYGMYRFAKP